MKSSPQTVVGDDIKSQVGATIVHRVLARLFRERGVKLERTSQFDVGSNMDFYNMLERSRLESKKVSKTNAVASQVWTTTSAPRTYTSGREARQMVEEFIGAAVSVG